MQRKLYNVSKICYTNYALMNGQAPLTERIESEGHAIPTINQYGELSNSAITIHWLNFYEEGILEMDGETVLVKKERLDFVTFEHGWAIYEFETELEELTYRQWYIHRKTE